MPWGSPNRHQALQQGALALVDYPLTLVGDADFQGFWRCDLLTTDGSTISRIDDRTGHGRHATQALTLSQPNYDTVNFMQPSAGFTGGPYLGVSTALAAAMAADGWTTWTVFACADIGQAFEFIITIGTATGWSLTIESSALVMRSTGVGSATDSAADTDAHLLLVTRSGGIIHIYLDGVEQSVASSNVGVSAPTGISALGAFTSGVFPFIGWGFEWGVFSRALTSGERASLAMYVPRWYMFT